MTFQDIRRYNFQFYMSQFRFIKKRFLKSFAKVNYKHRLPSIDVLMRWSAIPITQVFSAIELKLLYATSQTLRLREKSLQLSELFGPKNGIVFDPNN